MDPDKILEILPKGFVLNTDYIYEEVAKYPVVPPEKIREYWHVYTTTFRKLIDPTANRLENFWWHVMGSDRRFLSGKILSEIFRKISNEPAFVPLRSRANRYEGPSPAPPRPVAQHAATVASPNELRHGDGRVEREQHKSKKTVKPQMSSSSRPPPTHPILKKSSQPSASGPRPTARFVSPADSELEDGTRDSEAASSSSTAVNSGQDTKESSSVASERERRKSTSSTPKKKVQTRIASSATKRRPAMPRRQSSQSSTGASDVGTNSTNTKHVASQRPVSPVVERPGKASCKNAGAGERLSAKSAGKRTVRTSGGNSSSSRSGGSQSASSQSPPEVVAEDLTDMDEQKTVSDRKVKIPARDVGQAVTGSPHRRSDAHERERPSMVTPMMKSRSDIGGRPVSQEYPGRVPSRGLISSTTATTSNIAAQGTIIEYDENAPAQAITNAIRAAQEAEAEGGRPRPAMPTAQFTPTAPSTTPSVPLGRSKSQLTLLLERDNSKKPRR